MIHLRILCTSIFHPRDRLMHPLDDVYWGILYYMSYYFADYEQIGLYLPQYGYRRSAVHVGEKWYP